MRRIDRRTFVRNSMALTAALGAAPMGLGADAAANPFAAFGAPFAHPPDGASPGVYWFWLSGNVTRDAITRDLEHYRKAGIGTIWLGSGGKLAPTLIDPPVEYMSPAWRDAFRHTLSECARLGLRLVPNNCDGWSHSGGPWVAPEDAMQHVVCAETIVHGPGDIAVDLPLPPHKANYAEIGVFAVPVSPDEAWSMRDTPPAVATPADVVGSWDMVWHGGDGVQLFPRAKEDTVPIDLTFERSVTVRALRCRLGLAARPGQAPRRNAPVVVTLQAVDESTATDCARLEPVFLNTMDPGTDEARTAQFAPRTSRRWRVLVPVPIRIFELELSGSPRIENWEDKSAQSAYLLPFAGASATPQTALAALDLTDRMNGQGRLTWAAPAGAWRILRLGHSWTGATVKPASAATPEVDKLSPAAVDRHFDAMTGTLLREMPEFAGRAFAGVAMDSWEAGSSNWTKDMESEFARRRGYPLKPWLPVLAGIAVEDGAQSERLLFDFRRTVGELVADGIFGRYRDRLHAHGMELWAEALGPAFVAFDKKQFPDGQPPASIILQQAADAFACKGKVDVPMGEFWRQAPGLNWWDALDVKEAASAAHVYAKKMTAAEAFTADPFNGWSDAPANLKALGDRNFCLGVTLMVLSQGVLQPFPDRAPGLTLGPFGIRYQWTTTWFGESGGWVAYLSRCQHVLRQGLFHADMLYYLGEDVPLRLWAGALEPAPAAGLDFDACSADALLSRVAVKDGRLVLPDGMRYRLLVLSQGGRAMTPQVLGKLKDLVEAGATVVGPKPPTVSPSLENYPHCDGVVAALVAALWGDLDGTTKRIRTVGLGRMVWGLTPAEVLSGDGIGRDFEAAGHEAEFAFIHRTAGETEIYFVSNQSPQSVSTDLLFRVTGKQPHIWDPVTGRQWKAALFEDVQGRTKVPLDFAPAQSFFVVFEGKPSARRKALANIPAQRDRLTLEGPWQVAFDPKWGGPAHVVFDSLIDWTAHTDDGIRHYSGSATYTRSFTLEAAPSKGRRVLLDLGQVANIATVTLNGKTLPTVWTAPWQADITQALVKGTNHLQISVTNLWVNRLAKDAGLPGAQRLT
jgi:alpha-L-rhamnosidase